MPVDGIGAGALDDLVGSDRGRPQFQQVAVHCAVGELALATAIASKGADAHPVSPGRQVEAAAVSALPGAPHHFSARWNRDGDLDDVLPRSGIGRSGLGLQDDAHRRAPGPPGEIDVQAQTGSGSDQAVRLTGEVPFEIAVETVVAPAQFEQPVVGLDHLVKQHSPHAPILAPGADGPIDVSARI